MVFTVSRLTIPPLRDRQEDIALLTDHYVEKISSDGAKKILLDLGNVSFVDSSGLGALIGTYSSVAKAGGDLKLLNLTKKIQDLLQVTRLYVVFDVYADEAEALGSFTDK